MTTTQTTMTKREMAELLADNEPSVAWGMQTRTYWINAYMRRSKADLIEVLDRLTR
jgi:hypothetical protein